MVRKPPAAKQLIYYSRFLSFMCWLMLFSLLIVGCMPAFRPKTSVVRQQVSQRKVRYFSDFIAIIAQPGDTFSSLALEYLGDSSMDWFISQFNGATSLSPGQEVIIPLKPYEKGGLTFAGYQTVPVLCYHKFSKTKDDKMTVTERNFKEQMQFLKEHGFRVITLDQLVEFINFEGQIPQRSVVITIDDGWRSAYDIAYPILERYGYPATIFVYTDMIVGSSSTLSYELLKTMSENGIDIQCHTKTHRNLNRKSKEESFTDYFEAIERELTFCREIIKQKLNINVKYLAYPYGETNRLVIALLMKLGYKGAFTTEANSNGFFVHPYRIARSMIYGDFDLADFKRSLKTFVYVPMR